MALYMEMFNFCTKVAKMSSYDANFAIFHLFHKLQDAAAHNNPKRRDNLDIQGFNNDKGQYGDNPN